MNILNVKPEASVAEVREAYQRMHEMNNPAQGGSAYLQTKVQNAHDHLIDTLTEPPPDDKKQ